MPETREELLDRIKSGTVIHCTTAEQARAALSFCREMGLGLYEYAEEWLDSRDDLNREYPNIRFDSAKNWVVRCSDDALSMRPTLEFEDIEPILQGDSRQEYEIDAAVFDSLFS